MLNLCTHVENNLNQWIRSK